VFPLSEIDGGGGSRLSLIALIAANLVPVFGVLFLGWSVAAILVLYWTENVIIGILNIPKMWACEGGTGNKIFITPFFAFHYGMFCFGHGAFISEIFDARPMFDSLLSGGPLLWTSASFLFSHLVSMLINFYGKREYEGRQVGTQMAIPYGRIVVLHIVILIGGFLVQLVGAPIIALLLLVVLKTGIDLAAHRLEHAKALESAKGHD